MPRANYPLGASSCGTVVQTRSDEKLNSPGSGMGDAETDRTGRILPPLELENRHNSMDFPGRQDWRLGLTTSSASGIRFPTWNFGATASYFIVGWSS
jgi:hypothetical protein